MAKRRNKNKKAGPVKVIRPAEATPAEIVEAHIATPEVAEDVAAAVDAPVIEEVAEEQAAAPIGDDAAATPDGDAIAADAAFEIQDAGQVGDEEASGTDVDAVAQQHPDAPVEETSAVTEAHGDGPVAEHSPAALDLAAIGDDGTLAGQVDVDASSEAVAASPPAAPLHEFDDASALLAQSIEVVASHEEPARAIESILIPGASAEATEVAAAFESADEAVAGSAPPRSSSRVLKLNKLQRHQRSDLQAEPEAEAPAPVEDERRAPSEPRMAAFEKLAEYQALSLAHVAGLPEEADVPGHWRGVGFGIGGRRFVAGFDEVVEVIRMPQVTHVPGTQPWMLGVANVRGTLLPVVDLKQFLEGERTVVYEGQRVMVVRQSGGNVAVLIDQLFGQRTFNDSHKVDVAASGGSRYDHFIKQIYRVGDSDWGVFSMAMLTRTPEFRQAAA